MFRCLIALLLLAGAAQAAELKVVPGSKKDEPMVDLAETCPGIAIELRYATTRNCAAKALYPRGARCFVRRSVAARLGRANAWLRERGLGLKVWDAYRPAAVQEVLWKIVRNREFVGDPARGGSYHTWGVAVDVTLVDATGKELKMPTDFDDFRPTAATIYRGKDEAIARNLSQLQQAMYHAGFMVMHDEWWHFVTRDHKAFAAVEMPLVAPAK